MVELGKKHNITRERARQISHRMFEKVFNIEGMFIKDLKDWEFYILSLEKEVTIWKEEDKNQDLFKKENCNLSTHFIFQIFSILLNNSHKHFENLYEKDFLLNCNFLIKKEFLFLFDG